MLIFEKNFGSLGDQWEDWPSLADMDLRSLVSTASVSESMHKEGWSIQAKISGAPIERFEANPQLVIPDAHFDSVFSALMLILEKIGFVWWGLDFLHKFCR